jgi:hypothetical protein
MSAKRFRVVFSGKFVKGSDPQQVLKRISALFKVAPERINTAFAKGQGSVIVSTNDKQQAERYVRGLRKAGAICAISTSSEAKVKTAPSLVKSVSHFDGSPLVVDPKTVPVDITLTTINCTRLSGDETCLNLNRKDRQRVPLNEINLVSIYNASFAEDDYRILFYIKTSKRPFGALCSAISFSDFPGVKGPNLLASLRSFLSFLHARNPGLILDRSTYDFAAGGAVLFYLKEEITLASALYSAMPEELRATKAEGLSYGAYTPEDSEEQTQKNTCPKCGHKREAGAKECPRCGLVFVNWSRSKRKKRSSVIVQGMEDPTTSWSSRFALKATVLLLAGLILPIPGAIFSFGKSYTLMPWNLFGLGEAAASLNLPQTESPPLYFALTVLLIALISGGMRFLRSSLIRHLSWLSGGLISLILMLIVFRPQGFALGFIFWPQSTKVGIFWAGGIIICTLLASLNHLRKFYLSPLNLPINDGRLRLIQILSSVALITISITLLFIALPLLASWPIKIILFILIPYALISIYSGLNVPPVLTRPLSLYARTLLILLPVLGTLAQHYVSSDPSALVIIPRGLAHASVANIKVALLLLASAILFGAGFVGFIIGELPKPMLRPTGALVPDEAEGQ